MVVLMVRALEACEQGQGFIHLTCEARNHAPFRQCAHIGCAMLHHRVAEGHLTIGSHGHGAFYHALLGSVTEGVLRRSPCPLLIVPAPKQDSP